MKNNFFIVMIPFWFTLFFLCISCDGMIFSRLFDKVYTVRYDGNGSTGGDPPSGPLTYHSGDSVSVLDNTGSLVRTCYSFTVWNTEQNGNGITYVPGAVFTIVNENVILYAQWEVLTPPAELKVLDIDQTSVKLSWEAAAGADSYTIFYLDTPGVSESNGTVVSGITGTSYSLSGLSGFKIYSFIVSAVYTDGQSLSCPRVNHICYSTLSPAGTVSVYAGTGVSGSADGPRLSAQFEYPSAITSDGNYLYISDDANGIRRIDISDNTVSTILPYSIGGLVTDGDYFYGLYDWQIVKIKISTLAMTVIAGAAGIAGYADGTGTAARFDSVWGMACDGANLYVSDRGNNCIRKVVISTGVVTTLAAGFNSPREIILFGTSLYVANQDDGLIQEVDITNGSVTPVAALTQPIGITTDGLNLYVITNIPPAPATLYRIDIATNTTTPIATGIGNYPYTITNDGTNLYIGNTIGCTILRVD